MARLLVLSGREVCQILASQGFTEARRRGSHIVMQKSESDSTGTGADTDHRELRSGTLRSIIRQSRLPRALFE